MKSTDATVTMTALWQGLMLEATQLKRMSSVFLSKNKTRRTSAFIPTLWREWRRRVIHPWAEKHLMLMHLLRQDLDNWRKCTGVFWPVRKESLVLSSWHNELLRQIKQLSIASLCVLCVYDLPLSESHSSLPMHPSSRIYRKVLMGNNIWFTLCIFSALHNF